MEIGQWFQVRPAFAGNHLDKVKAQMGKVVYIHPQERYVTLEFQGIHGNPRECFSFFELLKKK